MRAVCALRARRAERERRSALSTLLEAERSVRAAAEQQACEARCSSDAEAMLIADPADPQARLWRQIAADRLVGAKQRRGDAEQDRARAAARAFDARVAHERIAERARQVDEASAAEARRERYRRDLSEETDIAERAR